MLKTTRILALLLVLLLLASCSAPGQETDTAEGFTFTDALGREVTVNDPQRVACLIGSFADVWHLAGGTDTIVASANDTWTYFDIPLPEDILNLGSTKELNLEVLLSSEPDFVIASANTSLNVELEDTFEAMGLNVAYFSVSAFEDYLAMLDICTRITGCRENYTKYGEGIQAQVTAAMDRADGTRPSVLYVRASGSSCKVKNSDGSVLGEMLRDMDCVNIADSDESLLEQLSMEAILQADPDHIFIVMQGSDTAKVQAVLDDTLLDQPAWQSLTAVQEGRCHVMDQTLYNLKPNEKWGEAYAQLADILYPGA